MQDLDSFSQRIDRPLPTGQLFLALGKLALMLDPLSGELFSQRPVLSQHPSQGTGLIHAHHPPGPRHQALLKSVREDLGAPPTDLVSRHAPLNQEPSLTAVGNRQILIDQPTLLLNAVDAFNSQDNQLLETETTDSQTG